MYRVADPSSFDNTPELGMGYHFGVRVTSGEGFIVLNAEFAIRPDEIWRPEVFLRIREPATFEQAEIVVSNDVDLFLQSFGEWVSNHTAYRARTRLHESPPFPLVPQPGDGFVRFSAFSRDRRIGPGNSLRIGTYATTDGDASLALTGYGNVGRYALPNLMPAYYRFDIRVPAGTAGLLIGTAAPAFGQAGGGVEIEFVKGGPPGCVTGPLPIPEY